MNIISSWAMIHILFMSLAFGVFAATFLMGLAYLLEQRQLKSRHFGRFLTWLPSLETMDRVHFRVLIIGFVLLSIGILSGAVLSKTMEGRFFSEDPRQIAAIGTWILYGIFLNVRLKSSWRGRRSILLSLIGFVGVAAAYLALKHRVI
jgi:ABC-type uncharacterized transport system permease subunit